MENDCTCTVIDRCSYTTGGPGGDGGEGHVRGPYVDGGDRLSRATSEAEVLNVVPDIIPPRLRLHRKLPP